MIILLAGLPGTGKTTLAKHLASRTGGLVLNKDEVREAVFGPNNIEYTTEQDDLVMSKIIETASSILHEQPRQTIFLDGRPFAKRYQINQVLEAALAIHQSWRILLCTCSEETARKRLDLAAEHPAENRDFALYRKIQAGFESIDLPHTVIDTNQPEEICVERAMAALKAA